MYRFIGDFSEVKILRIVGRKPYNAVIAYKIGFVFAGILFGCKRYCFAVKCGCNRASPACVSVYNDR